MEKTYGNIWNMNNIWKKKIWKKPMEKDMETHSEKHMVKKNWGEKQMQKQVEIM